MPGRTSWTMDRPWFSGSINRRRLAGSAVTRIRLQDHDQGRLAVGEQLRLAVAGSVAPPGYLHAAAAGREEMAREYAVGVGDVKGAQVIGKRQIRLARLESLVEWPVIVLSHLQRAALLGHHLDTRPLHGLSRLRP